MCPRAPFYINNFSQTSQIFNFISYADDTTLLSTMSNFTNAHNDDVDTLINEELQIHGFPHTKKTPVPKINNIIITKVEHFYFLGLTLDTQLN